MPTDPFETALTKDIWAIVKDVNAIGWQDAVDEIDRRIVQTNDVDADAKTTGAIRPTRHNPLL